MEMKKNSHHAGVFSKVNVGLVLHLFTELFLPGIVA